ncbi:MAG: hypothetical protein RJB47_1319 [Pseudomonadota bacterium]
MNIDWTHFTPWASLTGGVILGLASAIFILINGRVLGISGILGGLMPPKVGDTSWRIAFMLGLFAAPTVFHAVVPTQFITAPRIDATDVMVVIAGLLVGIGTRYASGCTSGHGVCGLSRLSPRSLLATASFMSAGFVMVFVLRHVL